MPAPGRGHKGLKKKVMKWSSPGPETLKEPQMNTPAPIRKIFEGVATRPQMFRLFDRHNQRPDRWQTDAAPLYSGEWFEIDEALYGITTRK